MICDEGGRNVLNPARHLLELVGRNGQTVLEETPLLGLLAGFLHHPSSGQGLDA